MEVGVSTLSDFCSVFEERGAHAEKRTRRKEDTQERETVNLVSVLSKRF